MQMKHTLLATAMIAASLAGGQAIAACDEGELVIKFSHVTNTDKHPKGIAATLLQERVNAEMNGVACMEVFPNSTLYNDDKVLEAMLNGDVQMAAPSLSKFEKFTKKFRLFDLPFMFRDVDAVDAFQNSEDGQALKDSMVRRGLKGLAFWHNGMKQMSANKPLIAPSDAEGLKFRVQLKYRTASLNPTTASSITSWSPRLIGGKVWIQAFVINSQPFLLKLPNCEMRNQQRLMKPAKRRLSKPVV